MLLNLAAVQAQQPHVIVITGVAGEPQYNQLFHEWAVGLIDGMKVPLDRVIYLGEKPELAPQRIRAKSTRQSIEAAFQEVAGKSQSGETVLIALIGHGSAEPGEPRFNVTGPDLTARDMARLLKLLDGRRVGLINAASSSGAFIEPLAANGRIIVTATRSGREQNETVFAKYLGAAVSGGDADKDGRVSLLEAYTYARNEVERFYREQNRLITEHAQLEDDGDGKGTPAPDGKTGDGAVARTFYLSGGASIAATADPRMRALLEEKQVLEEKIETLKAMKPKLDATLYEKELEKLLVDLALKNQEIRKAGVKQ